MTHTASHIIVSALKTPTKANGKRPVYYYVAGLCGLVLVLGIILGRCSA